MDDQMISVNLGDMPNIDYVRLLRYIQDSPESFKAIAENYLKKNRRWVEQQQEIDSLKREIQNLEEQVKNAEMKYAALESTIETQGRPIVSRTNIDADDVKIINGVMQFIGHAQRVVDIECILDKFSNKPSTSQSGHNISDQHSRVVDSIGGQHLRVVDSIGGQHLRVVDNIGGQHSKSVQTEEINLISDEENNEIDDNRLTKDEGSNNDEGPNKDEKEIEYIPTPSNVNKKIPRPGINERKLLQIGDRVFAASNFIDLTYPWNTAMIIGTNSLSKSYRIKFECLDQRVGEVVEPFKLAYIDNPKYLLNVGERVVAYIKSQLTQNKVYKHAYSGTVAEQPRPTNSYRYLVFFDIDAYHYVEQDEIFLICDNTMNALDPKYGINEDFCNFIKDYKKKFPERPMLRLQNQAKVRLKYKGNWEWAVVKCAEGSLILIEYLGHNLKRTEWIYRGSYRLFEIHKLVEQKNKRNRHLKSLPLRSLEQRSERSFVEWNTEDDIEYETNKKIESLKKLYPDEDFKGSKKIKLKQTARKTMASSSSSSLTEDSSFTKVEVVKKSQILPKKKPCYIPHHCDSLCLQDAYENQNFHDQNPFFIPILAGWRREKFIIENKGARIVYRTPCGRRLKSVDEVYSYLRTINSELDIDLFSFSPGLKIFRNTCTSVVNAKYYVEDITNGLEPLPISCVNTVNNDKIKNVEYYNERFPHPQVLFKPDPEFLSCCDCTDNCANKLTCACQQLTVDLVEAVPKAKPLCPGYINKRLQEFVMTGIFECNVKCPCKSTCPNRVVQNGIKCRLQLFKTLNKGWGVRVLHDVPKGTFLCVYAAQLINENIAEKAGLEQGDEYLAELDYIDVCEHHKENYESDVEDPEDINYELDDSESEDDDNDDDDDDYGGCWYTSRKHKKNNNDKYKETYLEDNKSETLESNLSRETRRKNRAENTRPKYLALRDYFREDFTYILDAKKKGNIGRYLNHSCDPNSFVQNVFIDTHDPRFPCVAFFAKRDISAFTELTWDYNYEIGSVPGRKLYCYCGAANCSKRLL